MATTGSRIFHAVPRLALVIAAACSSAGESGRAGDSASASASGAQRCAGDNAGLTLPEGFCAAIFADSVGRARHVAIADNGDVYVTLEGTRPSPEGRIAGKEQQAQPAAVVALRDTTRDGRADVRARIGSLGNTGVALFNNFLYVDEGKRIVRYARQPDELSPSGKAEVVVQGLPLEPGHRARNIAIGSDGALYVNVGSATNSCQVKDRGDASPGHDPCTELQTRAGIWKFDANKTGQAFSRSARFATGQRNAMGIAVHPSSGQVWATQHGRDQLFNNWPKIFPSTKTSADNPAEELMQVSQNDDFGWPYCYYSADEKKRVTAPEYGGDGKKTERCDNFKNPAATFPGHWAPNSLMFYSGTQFPERYRNGAFIAFHGSWNRAPEIQEGYRVVFQPLDGDKASGDFETFANGFAGVPDAELQPGSAKHRPMGVAQAPDGSIYVTDDTGGRIYRIWYAGK